MCLHDNNAAARPLPFEEKKRKGKLQLAGRD